MLTRFKLGLGRWLNAIGFPGLIRPSACETRLGVPIEVRVDSGYTVVSVSNLRLMFRRFSGRLDGVFVEGDDCSTPRPAVVANPRRPSA